VTGDVHCALMMTLAAKHRALVRSPSPEPPVAHKPKGPNVKLGFGEPPRKQTQGSSKIGS
jgi:hypothetical protein